MPRLLKPFRQCQPLSPCVSGLQLRYPGITQVTRKMAFPINRSARKRTFPLRAVAIVLRQFDVFVSPQFVTAPCHRFFPASASLGVIRATHHVPRCNPDTSHGQGLHALLTMLLELTSSDDASTFHIVNPALIRSPAQTQDTTKFALLPNT